MREFAARMVWASALLIIGTRAGGQASSVLSPPSNNAHSSFRFGQYQRAIDNLNDPTAVAVDEQGNIYITNGATAGVSVFAADGTPVRTWGGIGAEDGKLIAPSGIALASGEVFVSDAGLHEVHVFDETGVFKRRFGGHGAESGRFSGPAGLSIREGKVYIVDSGNKRVQAFGAEGKFLFSFGGPGKENGQFSKPSSIAFDNAGHLYVADAENNRIQKFDPDGKFIAAWGEWGPFPGFFDEPSALAIHGDSIYVTDKRNHRVQIFDLNGTLIEEWGVHELTPHEGGGKLHYPNGLAIAASGAFAVICEGIENRCQLFAHRAPGAPAVPPVLYDKAARTHFGEHLDIDGRLLTIAEPENHFIFIFDIDREVPVIINQFGERGEKFGLLLRTAGLDVDLAQRTILVSDLVTQRLQQYRFEYDSNAPARVLPEMTRFATSWQIAQLFEGVASPKPRWPIEPAAIRYDREGNLHLVDPRNDRIFVFDSSMRFIRAWGEHGGGPGQLRNPTDIAFSKSGERVYVVDALNRRVEAFDRQGKFLFTFGSPGEGPGQFLQPFGIAAGRDGFLYVTDAGLNRVQKFDEEGKLISAWGALGSGMGQLWKPKGIAQDDRLRLFVVDYGNHRAQIFEPEGRWQVTFASGMAFTPAMMPPPKE